jgi:predicted ATP-dependent endonuclease of OLD family
MKIAKIHIENHLILGDIDFNFTGSDGKTLDTIVIAGVNGTGKTALLNTIMTSFGFHAPIYGYGSFDLDISTLSKHKVYNKFISEFRIPKSQNIITLDRGNKLQNILKEINESERPKLIYIPTEINFETLRIETLSFSQRYAFTNIVDQSMIKNIPSFIATLINNEVYKNPDFPTKKSIDKVCNEINSLFEILEIDAKIVGLNPEGEKLPIFKNSAGKVFNIKELSSGEKQLFIRSMTLRMLNANNSIILIDEPEISMHPKWQQRIMKVYENIGENNQIIAATHSPHVVASVPKESVKLLKRENGRIKVVEYDEINGSYGLPVDIVLKELMELDTLRDPEVEKEIRALWDMLHQKKHDTKYFNERYQQLENMLGSEDEELLLMRIEIAKLRSKREKTSVGNKKSSST